MIKAEKDELTDFMEIYLRFQIEALIPEVERLLGEGVSPRTFLRGAQDCMETIGRKYDNGEYYLPELLVAGEMFKKVSERIRPHLEGARLAETGSIVIGTPKGDIHNLGKDIFCVLAESSGITVHDLGVDVEPAVFVEKLDETGANYLGMSALVTAAFSSMQEVINLLEENGVRKRVKVIIGGGVTSKETAARMRVDAQTRDAYEGLRIVQAFSQKGDRQRAQT